MTISNEVGPQKVMLFLHSFSYSVQYVSRMSSICEKQTSTNRRDGLYVDYTRQTRNRNFSSPHIKAFKLLFFISNGRDKKETSPATVAAV